MPSKLASSKLRQGTLSFAASKRTTSSSSIGKKQSARNTAPSWAPAVTISSEEDEDELDDIESPSSDEESEDIDSTESEKPKIEERILPATRSTATRSAKKLKESKPVDPVDPVDVGVFKPKGNVENIEAGNKTVDGSLLPELNEKDPKWRKLHGQAREKHGHLPLIHAEGQSKIHDILRVFDMTTDYGPCVGVTRLERWKRAKALGLNPSQEIYDILTTREGVSKTEYSQSVLFTMVV